MIWGNVTVGVTHTSVSSDRLPKAFDGFRIAVVSDLHNARFGKGNQPIIDLIRQDQPDLIAITGDLVDADRTDIDTAIDLVSALTQIAPCYYVTGNHEAAIGRLCSAMEEELLRLHVTILHDQVVTIAKDGQSIQLAGLEDPAFAARGGALQSVALKDALERMEIGDGYCVLLSHRPEAFSVYAEEKLDLVLSGHAHGGQFRLPLIGGLIAPNQGLFPEYDAGVYTRERTTMIVSRGIGSSIIPVRFNNRPEIVAVELLSAV